MPSAPATESTCCTRPSTRRRASAPTKKNSTASLQGANIIFIVKPEEALVLKWLKDAATYYKDSNIEMVLRSPADEEQADTNLVVNFNYMREKYNLAPPPSLPSASR